jgi:energy-converting hydrogenase Eha subunit A
MGLTILQLLTIMSRRYPRFRSRREVLLTPIALLCLCACRGATEPCRSDCWTTKASMPTPRQGLGVGVVNGVLYAVGGNQSMVVEAYDPVANTWTTKASMPTHRSDLGVGVVNGVLYAVGGESIGLTHCHFTGEGPFVGVVEAYDPVTDTWTTRASMPTPRAFLGVGVVNGVLYAVGGGNCSGSAPGAVEAYDPVADTWTIKASMPPPLGGARVGVVNGGLYAVGGGDLGVVEAYDPVADTWTIKASMPPPLGGARVGVVNGVLYAVGGGDLGVVEAYDPVADTWTTKASMPTPRTGFGVGVVNGVLYAVGGENTLSITIVGVNEAYQP